MSKIQKLAVKKNGSVMIIIVVILTFSALLILASVKLTNLKNAKNNPLYLANINKTHGKFICYKKANGNLNSVYLHYSSDGTVLREVADDTSECSFKVPNDVAEYKLLVVGGGAGGGNSTVSSVEPELSSENSLNITSNETMYFKDTMKYFGQNSIAMSDIGYVAPVVNWLKHDFLNNIVKNYTSHDEEGVAFKGGKCATNIDNSTKSFVGNLVSKGKLFDYLNIVFSNTPLCNIVKKGSGEYILVGSTLDEKGEPFPDSFDIKNCLNKESCNNEADPCCKYKNALNTDGENSLSEDAQSRTFVENAFEYLYKITDPNLKVSYVPVGTRDGFLLYFLRNSFKVREGLPGEPGVVVQCSTPSLPADNNGNFVITNNMIGAGGIGGAEPTSGGSTEIAGISECSVAYGGNVNFAQNEHAISGFSKAIDISSAPGKIPAEKIPYADFELNNLSAGYYDAESNKTYDATMPGASGSSGAIKLSLKQDSLCQRGYVVNSSNIQIFPPLSIENCRDASANNPAGIIEATNGAGGAVVIAW